MTLLIAEDFDALADGVALEPTNTSCDIVDDTGSSAATADTAFAISGGVSGRLHTTGDGHSALRWEGSLPSRPHMFMRAYFRLSALPTASNVIADANDDTGTSAADIQIKASGGLAARDGFTAVYETQPISAGAWYRLLWEIDHTNARQRLQLYHPANVNGTTPDEDSGYVSYTTGLDIGQMAFGLVGSPSTPIDMWVDAIAVDDAAMPGPVAPPVAVSGIYRETPSGLAVVQAYRETASGLTVT